LLQGADEHGRHFLAYQPPAIELRRGAGAYICGEESALIESLEGKRGMPRLKPPIVALHGVFGRPTLAHNLESLWWVPVILDKGGAWLAAQGRRGRSGLRRFSVSGRVNRPGVHLAPAGITLRELVDEFAGGMAPGHELYAYLPGGASGGILPARLADVPLDFDTLAEHGCFIGSMAVVVLSQHDRARDAALNLMQFFEHESCGQCTPCRAGTTKAVQLLQAPVWDAALLGELSQVMRDASICGLGQAAPNPVDSVLRFFAHEVNGEEVPDEDQRPAPRHGAHCLHAGRPATGSPPGETLLQVAPRVGIELPHLCHSERLGSPGNCRACVVEIEGERVLAPSCCRAPQTGMVVKTASPRANSARKTVLELLLSDAPDTDRSSTTASWRSGPRGRSPAGTLPRQTRVRRKTCPMWPCP
jgi:ferredoxin